MSGGGPPLALRRRLHVFTGYRCPPFDSPAVREATLVALARAAGNQAGALRLEAASREGALELKRIADRREAELYAHEHASLFMRLASSIFKHEFTQDRFWRQVASVLGDSSRARASADVKSSAVDNDLDARVRLVLASEPLLCFPTATGAGTDGSLLNAVLADQRGLDPTHPFLASTAVLYDRRYCAALRHQLYFAEARLAYANSRLRVMEHAVDSVLHAGSLDECLVVATQAVRQAQVLPPHTSEREPTPAELKRTVHRRLAATLRDLSEELRVLPDRINVAAMAPARRQTPPQWLANTLRLARLAAFDATSVGLMEDF